jgi:uncharacterized glyoxalase superfamily protein PhnB
MLEDDLFEELQQVANEAFNGNTTKLIKFYCRHGLATLDADVIKLVEEDANYVSKK